MTAEEFVQGFYQLRDTMMRSYFDPASTTQVAAQIRALALDEQHTEQLKEILSNALRDHSYTILLGLDGAAGIGDKQILYRILDEEDRELTGGDIEAYAYDYFHNKDSERTANR